MKTIETSKIKQMNIALIKAALKAMPGNTKANIAAATGLSQATCNTILNELVASGEVLELDKENSGGGRPAQRFIYNGDYANAICLYVDNDSNKPVIFYAVINLLGIVKEQDTIQKDFIDYNTIEDLIDGLIKKYQNIKAAAIGIPGVVIRRDYISTCDIKELSDCFLADKLKDRFDIAVTLENDMNLTALGYYRDQDYLEDTSIVVLNFLKDNCPGSGIIIDGQIVPGHTNFAGEISYIPLENSPEEYSRKLRSHEGVIDIAARTICTIAAVINPETVLLTGTLISDGMMEEIKKASSRYIPEQHMPILIFNKNIHDYYLKGLTGMALESLSSPLPAMDGKI